ncbi:hypothetical protein CC2G_006670 [Coprinopsis cinerea AmutBmut pab1-1]|nr:hypothetical protein CC2G_006670 [Coprinopsis cinerea AmutBmut pab1-1]
MSAQTPKTFTTLRLRSSSSIRLGSGQHTLYCVVTLQPPANRETRIESFSLDLDVGTMGDGTLKWSVHDVEPNRDLHGAFPRWCPHLMVSTPHRFPPVFSFSAVEWVEDSLMQGTESLDGPLSLSLSVDPEPTTLVIQMNLTLMRASVIRVYAKSRVALEDLLDTEDEVDECDPKNDLEFQR